MMHRSRSIAAAFIATVLAAGTLAGCTATGGSGGDGDDVISIWYRPGSIPQSAIDGVQAAFPDTEIELVESADLNERLSAALRADSGIPDVVVAVPYQWESVQDKFLDVSEHGFQASDFVAWKVKNGEGTDGRQLGIPIDVGPYGFYYKPADFEAAGLPSDPDEVGELVSTWDGYFDVAEKIKESGKFACDDAAAVFTYARTSEGFAWYVDGKFDPDNPLSKESVETAMRLQTAGVCANVGTYSTDWNASVAQGQTVGFLQPPWVGGGILQTAAPDQAGLWRVATKSPTGPTSTVGSTLMVSASTPDPDLATEIAMWLVNGDNQTLAYPALFPSSLAALDSDALNAPQDYYGGQAAGAVLAQFAKDAPIFAEGPNTDVLSGIFQSAIRDSLSNGQSASEVYDAARARVKEELGE